MSDRRSNNHTRRSGESARKAEKARVRRQILVTSGIVGGLFAAMVVYIVVYAASNEQTLFENDYNGREELLLSQNMRGKIYADDGASILAQSTADTDGNQTREYPYGNLFAHVVGYTEHGGAGIELYSNYDLVHSDISLSEKASYDAAGELYPSDDIYTTLRTDLQQAASDALGDNQGAVIVTDVDTGAILCMISKPDYDPSTILEDWDTLMADSTSGTFVNRATQGTYAPGSTFKIFDAVEFMTEDMTTAMNYSFNCPGYVTIDGETINCYSWEVHGTVNLEESFAESCNSSFATIGTSLNRVDFKNALDNMLFGDTSGLYDQVPDGVSSSSYVLETNTETKEVMQLSIGQGQTLMTPLHLNLITAAIGNGGTVYKPYVVESVRTGTGKVMSTTEPAAYKTVMSSEVAEKMREMMRLVVTNGTGSKLSTRTYNPGGKTGSAEYVSGSKVSHAWFTGIAPVEDPEIAITVIVEGAGIGGTSAVPVARSVMDAYFGYTPAEGEDENIRAHVANDHDGDGIPDQNQTDTTTSNEDAPQNTVSLNLDTNGDGILDAIDIDGDGIADAYDTDGDGRVDTNIGASSQNVTTVTPTNTTDTTADTTGNADQTESTGDPAADETGDGAANGGADGTTDTADQNPVDSTDTTGDDTGDMGGDTTGTDGTVIPEAVEVADPGTGDVAAQ